MNITSYLPDDLVQAVDQLAHANRSSRSAIIREALEVYLERFKVSGWPEDLVNWQGDPTFTPFEALRGESAVQSRDPFEGSDL